MDSARNHSPAGTSEALLGSVLDLLLRENFKVVDDSPGFSNNDFASDLRYLVSKTSYTDQHIAWLVRTYGESVVTEALRRGHGEEWTPGYLVGVCRNVAADA